MANENTLLIYYSTISLFYCILLGILVGRFYSLDNFTKVYKICFDVDVNPSTRRCSSPTPCIMNGQKVKDRYVMSTCVN